MKMHLTNKFQLATTKFVRFRKYEFYELKKLLFIFLCGSVWQSDTAVFFFFFYSTLLELVFEWIFPRRRYCPNRPNGGLKQLYLKMLSEIN